MSEYCAWCQISDSSKKQLTKKVIEFVKINCDGYSKISEDHKKVEFNFYYGGNQKDIREFKQITKIACIRDGLILKEVTDCGFGYEDEVRDVVYYVSLNKEWREIVKIEAKIEEIE